MRKIFISIPLAFFIFSASAFADDASMSMNNSACSVLAKACKTAGFSKKSSDKKFWKDCMKPLILGKSVTGVKITADQVKNCRMQKINELQKELQEFQNVK